MKRESESCSVVSDSLRPHGLYSPWNSPCQNTGVGSHISSIKFSCIRLFVTPRTAAHQASLSITNSQSPPKLISIESVMPSNHFIPCCPLLLLPSIFPNIRSFQMSQLFALGAQVPKVLEF